MSKNNINMLIDKYFDGKTNLEEERFLKSYFNSESEMDAELKVFIPFFRDVESSKLIKAPSDLEQNVLAVISNPKIISLPKSDDEGKVRRLFPLLMKVASVFVIGVGLYFMIQQFTPSSTKVAMTEDTYDTPEEAFEAYKAAIALASRKIKKGENKVKNEISHVKILTSIVKKK